jgi:PEP-CTERM motif
MKLSIARFAGLLAIFLCGNALATIVGTFNIAGNMTVTNTGITWTSNVPPNSADQANIGPGPTGIYSALAGTTATIHSLNSATEPVGVAFPAQSFISFDANPTLSSLLINFIFAGIYSSAQCAASPAAVGQTCTPSLLSPFNFVNNPPPPPAGPQATMTWSASGVSADGLDTWVGNFTSQFGTSFQTVLAGLQNTGSFSTSYSATITVQTASSSVPEPSTVALIALALMSMLFFLRRRSMS